MIVANSSPTVVGRGSLIEIQQLVEPTNTFSKVIAPVGLTNHLFYLKWDGNAPNELPTGFAFICTTSDPNFLSIALPEPADVIELSSIATDNGELLISVSGLFAYLVVFGRVTSENGTLSVRYMGSR